MTDVLLKLFIKSKDYTSKSTRSKVGNLGSVVGIICNILLSAFKISVGFIAGSMSIVADGFNNLADMGSSVITMIGFKLANMPADEDHPFGHGRMEYISAFIVSFLMLIVGFELASDAIKSLIAAEAQPIYSTLSIFVLAFSIFLKLWMFLFNRKLGKKIDSSALVACAKDSLNDCVATGAILTVAIISRFVTLPFNLDAILTIAVALFIMWAGISSAKETLNEILGTPPSPELIADIKDGILAFDGFLDVHDLIVHNYGPGRQFASVHVEVPHDVNIVECHEKIDICEKIVSEKTGVYLVIHMDPIDTDSEAVQKAKSQMIEIITDIDPRLSLHDFRMTPAAQQRTNLIFDVVVPPKFAHTHKELNQMICQRASEADKTYACVITFDQSHIG